MQSYEWPDAIQDQSFTYLAPYQPLLSLEAPPCRLQGDSGALCCLPEAGPRSTTACKAYCCFAYLFGSGAFAEMVLRAASVDMINVAFNGAPAQTIPRKIREMNSALPGQPMPPQTALISRHQGSASPNLLESPFAWST